MGILVESGIMINSGIAIGDIPVPGIRTAHTITPTGTAQITTSRYKFGTGSYTNNSGSGYLSVTPLTDLAFGISDFTVEFWYYAVASADAIPFGMRPVGQTTGPYLTVMFYSTNAIGVYSNGAYRYTSAAGSLVNGQWSAVAIVRYNSVTTLYVNGIALGSFVDTLSYQAGNCIIGAMDRLTTGTFAIKGNIDELRISNIARYTGNYTPATAPFANDNNTLLLMHCDGTNGSTTFIDTVT